MLTYSCRVIDTLGDVQTVIEQGENQEDLAKLLLERGMTLLSSKRAGTNKGLKLKPHSIIEFTQTLSLLLDSNLSLKDAINISTTTFKDSALKAISQSLVLGLDKGESFRNILQNNAYGFPPVYLGLIEVGEKTGELNLVLNQLSKYLKRNKKFNDKLKGAMIYPVFILIISLLFSLVFILVILPQFNSMLSTFGGGVTDILERRGRITTYVIVIFFSILSSILTLLLYVKRLKKKNLIKASIIEKVYLKIPIIGKIILETETLNLIFSLKVLAESSVTIEESLVFGEKVLTNSFLIVEVKKIREKIINGQNLSTAFNNSIFPSKLGSFIKVGEKTGDINRIFSSLADYYLNETDNQIDRFMAMIEPGFTLVIGAALFSLILLFVFPLLTSMGAIG